MKYDLKYMPLGRWLQNRLTAVSWMFIGGASFPYTHRCSGAATVCALYSSSPQSIQFWYFSDFEGGFDEMLLFGMFTI